jgi:hypothetical protein
MATFLVALALAVAAAVLVSAGTLTLVQCDDHQCRVNCRTLQRAPTGKCLKQPFQSDESSILSCVPPVPNSKCVYRAAFRRNATGGATCDDNSTYALIMQQCDRCYFDKHSRSYSLMTGCSSSTTLSLKVNCNADCSSCAHWYPFKEKTCIVLPDPVLNPFAFGFSAPVPCPTQYVYKNYNASDDCEGAFEQGDGFSDSCIFWGKREKVSHKYTCS